LRALRSKKKGQIAIVEISHAVWTFSAIRRREEVQRKEWQHPSSETLRLKKKKKKETIYGQNGDDGDGLEKKEAKFCSESEPSTFRKGKTRFEKGRVGSACPGKGRTC